MGTKIYPGDLGTHFRAIILCAPACCQRPLRLPLLAACVPSASRKMRLGSQVYKHPRSPRKKGIEQNILKETREITKATKTD